MHSSFATTTLLVAVTLLLIAFFVFLNAAAAPDVKRKEAVLRSLEQQFVGKQLRQPSAPSGGTNPNPPASAVPATDGFSNRVRDLAVLFEKLGFEQKQLRNQLLVIVPVDKVFNADDDQIKAAFLKTLGLLTADAKRAGLDIEIRCLAAENGTAPQDQSKRLSKSAARAVSLYRYFLDSGIPSERMSAAGLLGNTNQSSTSTAIPAPDRIELRFMIPAEQK